MPALTVIIPALNAAITLPRVLASLHRGDGCIVVDGGSSDATVACAERFGATAVRAPRGRGQQLRAGAHCVQTEWMLFLHADTALQEGWRAEVERFMCATTGTGRAAVFQFGLDDGSSAARRLERWVKWRTQSLGLPYGDQALLINRTLYDQIGGYRPIPIMEDVDIVRRIGRRRLVLLTSRAVTSAQRWRREGWLRRSARNLLCLSLYFIGVPPTTIARVYGQ